MDNQPKLPMPAHLAALVEACIISARQELTRVGHIQPVAFIGHSGEMKTFIFPLEDANSKEEAMAFIRQLAARMNADFVFTMTEAWMLKPGHTRQYQEIIEQYGSLENTPDSIECVVFMLETHTGSWFGVAEQKPLADSSGKTFGEVEMIPQKNPEGRLTGLLQSRNNGEVVH
ncbi:hypothetical protein [Serratia sp. (in: enterobacteria)]|uniref:hypothetical protein n=1 Tax=Serratia sp. (in: enterobacteria) TaxID=616 RepID=UPI0039899B43